MKKMKFLLTALCVALMLFGVMTTASALSITPASVPQWTWQPYATNNPYYPVISDPRYNNPDAEVVSLVTGNTVQELYKQDQGQSADSGTFASSYNTEFSNTPSDPEDATITHVANMPVISGSPIYLLVKDGNHDPIWYIFNLTVLGWDGEDSIEMSGFWPNGGAISHVSLYGPSPVPIPAAVWLLGSGLLGLVGIRRRLRK